jgi:hypothetical protein
LTSLDATDTVSTLMVNEAINPLACAKLVGDLINKAMKGVRGHCRIVILGVRANLVGRR